MLGVSLMAAHVIAGAIIYYTFGGLPLVASMTADEERIEYLRGLFDTVYLRDICERNDIRHEEPLEALISILASADGSLTNGEGWVFTWC